MGSPIVAAFERGRQARLQMEARAEEQEERKLRIEALRARMAQEKVELKWRARQNAIQDAQNTPIGQGAGGISPDGGSGIGNFQPPAGQQLEVPDHVRQMIMSRANPPAAPEMLNQQQGLLQALQRPVQLGQGGPVAQSAQPHGQLNLPEQRIAPNSATQGYGPITIPGVEEEGIEGRTDTAANIQNMIMQRKMQDAKIAAMGRPDQSITPFEAWQKRNPNKPISEWFKESTANTPRAAPRTILTSQGVMQWNPETKAYDIKAGDRPPSLASGGDDGSKRLTVEELKNFPELSMGATRADARGMRPKAGAAKPSSGVEKRAMNFFIRAENSSRDLEALESYIVNQGLGGQTWNALSPNMAQSEEAQKLRQAQRAFTEARLRKDSGAAIPPEEFANDIRTYFPYPGDTPATLAQKKRGREAVLAGLKFEAGRAYAEYTGQESDDPSGAGKPKTMTLPDGRKLTLGADGLYR